MCCRGNVRYFKSKHCDLAITTIHCKGGSVTELQKVRENEEQENGMSVISPQPPQENSYGLS